MNMMSTNSRLVSAKIQHELQFHLRPSKIHIKHDFVIQQKFQSNLKTDFLIHFIHRDPLFKLSIIIEDISFYMSAGK